MIAFLQLSQSTICKNIPQLSLYGESRTVKPGADGWVYFGVSYGDFGHTIEADVISKDGPLTVYRDDNHNCPTTNSTKSNGPTLIGSDGSNAHSRFAVFGALVDEGKRDQDVIIRIYSGVRPVHPNSGAALINALFVFFTCNFVICGFLQCFFYARAMDPREYIPN